MKLPTPSCVLSFDYGTRKVGVAIGDTLTQQARPLAVIAYASTAVLAQAISGYITQYAPKALVVGLPVHDEPSKITEAAESFARDISATYKLPVVLLDERFSSQAANAYRKTHPDLKDAIAAAIVLESFLANPESYEPL
ncbi:MAG: Holliday junction resolvase RuvX [Pseudomonadota bacterium]